MTGYYHTDLNTLHVGCEKPRAYFIPFSDSDNCEKRENSSFFTLLNGEWDFKFYENVYELDVMDGSFPSDEICGDKMTVPFNWQLKLGKGYDAPNYINQDYPYPVDPPHLPDTDPCGLYRRKFDLKKNPDKKYYINFEGVSSCFYLWINSEFVGYSEVSHCMSEFDITDRLTDGENKIEALVVKHCTGSYLEDQDFFRLSGIFRDVYILERDFRHIKDIQIIHELDDSLKTAQVELSIISDGIVKPFYTLYSPDGKEISSGIMCKKTSFEVTDVSLWTPETPVLYTLKIKCGDENLYFKLGMRRFEIKDSVVLLNGVKFKCRGINRHDSDPESGYAVTTESMIRDLRLLKRASVNMIRTSHYPNDPRFLEMCDEMGFAVVDEADLETHGMGYNYGDWYWDYWAYCSDSPEWRESYLDRAERLFERDKNHSCVLLWSLGNESGCGENHRAMANFIRSRDRRALIHYENAHLEYAERLGKDFSDISDVESRMYAPISYLEKYLGNDGYKKPFFYCEYVCSMSTGDVYRHWDNVEDDDKYFGGCIWELTDHAVNIGTKEEPKYRYGGDFGDDPNDNYSCVDGLVFPDRRPRPGYYDMKKVYKPFYAYYKNGKLLIKNRKFYTSLSEYYIKYEFEHNGEVVYSDIINDTDILPGETGEYGVCMPKVSGGLLTLNVYLALKNDCLWGEKDYVIGDEQIVISDGKEEYKLGDGRIEAEQSRTEIKVSCDKFTCRISRITGLINELSDKDGNYLTRPIDFSIWRCHNYNSRGFDDVWNRARFDRSTHHAYSVTLSEKSENKAVVNVKMSFCAPAMPPAIQCDTDYIITSEGIDVKCNAAVGDRVPNLPRFGLEIAIGKEFRNMSYFGFGPYESYADRFKACRLSKFTTNVDDNFVRYIKPQECSAHYKTRTACVTDENGRGLEFIDIDSDGFSFNAKRYTDRDLHDTKHDDELVKRDETIISLDYKIDSSSDNDEGREAFRHFNEKEFSFEYRIKVK